MMLHITFPITITVATHYESVWSNIKEYVSLQLDSHFCRTIFKKYKCLYYINAVNNLMRYILRLVTFSFLLSARMIVVNIFFCYACYLTH